MEKSTETGWQQVFKYLEGHGNGKHEDEGGIITGGKMVLKLNEK